jgi:hypothetical protein
MTLIAEPSLHGDIDEAEIGSRQQLLSHRDAAAHHVGMRSDAKRPAEHAEEMRG